MGLGTPLILPCGCRSLLRGIRIGFRGPLLGRFFAWSSIYQGGLLVRGIYWGLTVFVWLSGWMIILLVIISSRVNQLQHHNFLFIVVSVLRFHWRSVVRPLGSLLPLLRCDDYWEGVYTVKSLKNPANMVHNLFSPSWPWLIEFCSVVHLGLWRIVLKYFHLFHTRTPHHLEVGSILAELFLSSIMGQFLRDNEELGRSR